MIRRAFLSRAIGIAVASMFARSAWAQHAGHAGMSDMDRMDDMPGMPGMSGHAHHGRAPAAQIGRAHV